MSFSMPPVKPRPSASTKISIDNDSTPYGLPDYMMGGISNNVRNNLEMAHPLAESEANYQEHRNQMNTAILRNTQGLHAPLRLAMENKAAKKIGRLPFLASSNVMLESLSGRDLDMSPEDVFNLPEFRETLCQPHAVLEKSIGIL